MLYFFQCSGLYWPSWQTFRWICLFWPQIDVHWRRSLICTPVFDHSIVDWKEVYFQRCQLIWSNIKFSTGNILSSISTKVSLYQPLLIYSHSNVFLYYVSFIRNSVFLFPFLTVFLIVKLNHCKRNNNWRASPFLVAVIKIWLRAWFFSLLLLLSGDVELKPESKDNSKSAFSIDLSLESKQYIFSQLC